MTPAEHAAAPVLTPDAPQTRTIVQRGRTVVVQAPQVQPDEQPQAQPQLPEDTDADDDGVADDADNCKFVPNADQANFDADGFGDVCDSDDDNDNLSDGAEAGYGTNPFDKDSDGESWYDGNEVKWGTDPNDPSSYPQLVFPGDVKK